MKSRKLVLIFLSMFLMVLIMTTGAAAGKWKLYDDFESMAIDNEKWSTNPDHDDVAEPEAADYNGSRQAKFEYKGIAPDESCYLYFNHSKICSETIVGIKTKVTIDPGSSNLQDSEARISLHPGTYNGFYVWGTIRLRSNRKYINGGIGAIDQDDNYNYVRDIIWSSFDNTINQIGVQYTIYFIFDKKDQITVGVEGQGESTMKLPDKGQFDDPIEIFNVIGIRVNSGSGGTNASFIAYFDDVYIMTKGGCDKKAPKIKKTVPNKNAKKVDRSIEYIELHFSEPMNSEWWAANSDGGWDLSPSTPHIWSPDRKSMLFYRDNSGTPLDPNTTIQITFNPKEWIGQPEQDFFFRDIKGNLMKEYKFKFTTGD